jgi:hypothetical protein
MLGVDLLREFVGWLRSNALQGFVAEYGVPDTDARWLTVLDNALNYLDQNSDVIVGGAYWSSGSSWGIYPLSVEPTGTWPDVTDRPQMSVLVQHTGQKTGCGATTSPSATPVTPAGNSRTFPETGYTVGGLFLDYWESHGGLAQQGYPISAEMSEVSDLDGKAYTVQYFERAVFEHHPENPPPYNVLLSQLGTFQYQARYPWGAPDQTPDGTAGSRYFPETGHRVGGEFLKYWNEHGGLAQQGYPISDPFEEQSDLDGEIYMVQYFERAVFELHPEERGTPYEVLLSQLGTFQYEAKYGNR